MPHSLPAELTIYTLSALHAQCLTWLSSVSKPRKHAPWPLDASAVAEVDAAGVQLLVALSHSLSAKQKTLKLINPSQPLINACEALGLGILLNGAAGVGT